MSLLKTIKQATINTTCSTLGALHFITYTAADCVMHVEAGIRMRTDGAIMEDTKRERTLKTLERQQAILDRAEAAKEAMAKAKEKYNQRFNIQQTNTEML